MYHSGTVTEDPLDPVSNTPNDTMAEYYEQRATAGLVITEATAISEQGSGWRNAPHLRTPEQTEAWKKIVDRVHAKGAKFYAQLWHMGRQADPSFHPTTGTSSAPSAIAMDGTTTKSIDGQDMKAPVPKEMTVEEIQSTVEDYVAAAKRAQEAGFDGVEVHGGNGYLIDEFLQSKTNQRTDQYGGSMENRARFLIEVIEAIAASGAFPENRIGVRISPNGVFGDMGSADNYAMFTYLAKVLNDKFDMAYIHIMDGLGFGYHNVDKVVTTMDIRKNFDGPILFNVGLTKEIAEGMIRSGAGDMAVFGRLYISNPDLPERFANNWPVEPEASYENWWGPTGAKGYTDYPTYQATA